MAGAACPVCISSTNSSRKVGPLNQETEIDCPICGKFDLTDPALATIINKAKGNEYLSSVLSYYIRRMQSANVWPKIENKLVDEILKRELPSVVEQADNFILWLGDTTTPGEYLVLICFEHTRSSARIK